MCDFGIGNQTNELCDFGGGNMIYKNIGSCTKDKSDRLSKYKAGYKAESGSLKVSKMQNIKESRRKIHFATERGSQKLWKYDATQHSNSQEDITKTRPKTFPFYRKTIALESIFQQYMGNNSQLYGSVSEANKDNDLSSGVFVDPTQGLLSHMSLSSHYSAVHI